MHSLYVLNRGNALLFQVVSEITQRQVMPLYRFRAMVLTLMIKDVLLDGRTKRALYTTRRTLACLRCGCFRLTLLVARRHRNTSNCLRHSQQGRYVQPVHAIFACMRGRYSWLCEAGTQ